MSPPLRSTPALVNYSDSDSDSETEALPDSTGSKSNSLSANTKPCSLPPLPAKFHDLYASTVRTSTVDDPALHSGRKRATPHVEGRWPTHVFLEWYPTSVQRDCLTRLISTLRYAEESSRTTADKAFSGIKSLLTSDLHAPLPLHVSLSRSLSLATEQREPFADRLIESIKRSAVRPFTTSFVSMDWVANHEGTRWFLVLRPSALPANGLNRLLHVANETAFEFGYPPLYTKAEPSSPVVPGRSRDAMRKPNHLTQRRAPEMKRPEDQSAHFHVSVAWTLEEPPSAIVAATASETVAFALAQIQASLHADFASVKLKIGNTVTDVPLVSHAEESRGLVDA
ncbi:MAG: hypothetical protein M1825_000682 [Sarcosagium campestre]|nr:MAG: hypothetical protein M1825_000682 [Sarcosagium campestre]